MMDMIENDFNYENYLDSSVSDDNDDIEFSYSNCAKNILSRLDESSKRIDEYLAFERGYKLGDFVTFVEDPAGQIGQIVNVNLVVDLESSNGDAVKDLSSKALVKVRSFREGDYVVSGPWLGQISEVQDLVTVLLDNGVQYVITTENANLVPISSGLLDDGPYVYHTGQRVKITYPSSIKSSKWFWDECNNNQNEGTVCNIKVGQVVVKWIASLIAGSSVVTPPALQDVENLTLLSCLPHANWQIGDLCKLSPAYFENLEVNANVQVSSSSPLARPSDWLEVVLKNQAEEHIYIISKIKSKVDVLWQDGSCSMCMNLSALSAVLTISEHDFFPGQVVQERSSSEDTHMPSCQRLGIVECASALERIVKVKWVNSELNHTREFSGEIDIEIISAYELIRHPDCSYLPGDIVFRLPEHQEKSEVSNGGDNCPSEQLEESSHVQICDGSRCNECDYLSCIGNVIGLEDGAIKVKWANGFTSKGMSMKLAN